MVVVGLFSRFFFLNNNKKETKVFLLFIHGFARLLMYFLAFRQVIREIREPSERAERLSGEQAASSRAEKEQAATVDSQEPSLGQLVWPSNDLVAVR